LVPRQRGTPSLRQHGEPIVEPRGEALDAKRIDAGSRQFQRQRHAIEPATNLQHRRDIGIVEEKPVVRRDCALAEQLDGRIPHRLVGSGRGRLRRKFQRGQAMQPFAFGPQRFAAGGQNMNARSRLQDGFGQRRRCANDVFAAVEHDQSMLVAQPCSQPKYRVDPRERDPEHGAEGARHQVGISQRGERDEPHAVPVGRTQGFGDRDCHRGLADPARADDGQKTASG